MIENNNDEYWMRLALEQAVLAGENNEVPVGAVIVRDQQLVGQGGNQPISAVDPSAHAEIVALRNTAKRLGNYRLPGCVMYVTLEPCCMCAGALIHARLERLVFAAYDSKSGAVCSCLALLDQPFHNHKIEWQGGVLQQQSALLLSAFFKKRR